MPSVSMEFVWKWVHSSGRGLYSAYSATPDTVKYPRLLLPRHSRVSRAASGAPPCRAATSGALWGAHSMIGGLRIGQPDAVHATSRAGDYRQQTASKGSPRAPSQPARLSLAAHRPAEAHHRQSPRAPQPSGVPLSFITNLFAVEVDLPFVMLIDPPVSRSHWEAELEGGGIWVRGGCRVRAPPSAPSLQPWVPLEAPLAETALRGSGSCHGPGCG